MQTEPTKVTVIPKELKPSKLKCKGALRKRLIENNFSGGT
jgi:hypothetical protein